MRAINKSDENSEGNRPMTKTPVTHRFRLWMSMPIIMALTASCSSTLKTQDANTAKALPVESLEIASAEPVYLSTEERCNLSWFLAKLTIWNKDSYDNVVDISMVEEMKQTKSPLQDEYTLYTCSYWGLGITYKINQAER